MEDLEKTEAREISGVQVRGSNQSGLRAHNERLVLTLIRQMGPMAKSEIARITGLSAQTVSVIMRSLEADGMLEKGEPVRGRVGQPSVPMGLKADGAYFLGVKVGRRSVDLILIDFQGTIIKRTHRNHAYPEPDAVVDFVTRGAKQLLTGMTAARRARVAGLGIAIPFRLWEWAGPLGVDRSVMDAWIDRDIRQEIADRLDMPVYLQNDASSACGAELVFGDRDKPSEFLYFFIGFLVGGGLVLNNALYTGKHGNAAALGSMPIAQKDGSWRHLVDMASLAFLERAITGAGGDGASIWQGVKEWDVPEAPLEAWLDEAAQGLAVATISAANLIDIDAVFIDGWLPGPVRAELVARTDRAIDGIDFSGIDKPQVREGSIGADARALGAASLPLSNRFLIDPAAMLKG